MAKVELWRGQQAEKIRSQFFGAMGRGTKPDLFNNKDQDDFSQLKNKDLKLGVKPSPRSEQGRKLPGINKNESSNELSVDARMQNAAEDIEQRVAETLRDEKLNPTPEQNYIARLVAFDRQMGLMPEKPRSQVEKLANAITREFNLNGQESTGATTGTTVNPEVLLTNTTKDLLKTFNPENILVLAPLTLALMVVRAMPPEVKATLKRWYEKIPVNARHVLVLMMATVILAGCSAMAGTPTKEADPGNNNNPPAGEQTGLPSEEAATAEAATEEPLSEEEQRYQDIMVSIQEDPFYNTPYVQAREATSNGEIPEACVVMIKDLVTRQEIASAETLEERGINSNGDCYVRWTEEGVTTIVFDNKDTSGYLYVKYNPSEHPEGSVFEYKDPESSFWATISVDGKVIRAVDGRTSQWLDVVDGQMMGVDGQPTPIPTMTPINADPNETRPAIKMIDPEAIAKLVEDYQNGQLTDEEASKLNFDQQKAFAIALDDERDKQNGESEVSFTDESGKKLYLGKDGKFHPEKQTIDNTLPRATDKEGYVHVFYEGLWIRIEGSQNIRFDGDINWPDTDIIKPELVSEENQDLIGLTIPEYLFRKKDSRPKSMIAIFFPDKAVGERNIPGFGSTGTHTAYIINDFDQFSVRQVTITGGNLKIYEDGVAAGSSGSLKEGTGFFNELDLNTLYYLMYFTNQKTAFAETYPQSDGQEVTSGYSGIVPSNSTHDVLTGKSDNEGSLWVDGILIVKAQD